MDTGEGLWFLIYCFDTFFPKGRGVADRQPGGCIAIFEKVLDVPSVPTVNCVTTINFKNIVKIYYKVLKSAYKYIEINILKNLLTLKHCARVTTGSEQIMLLA